MNRLVKLIPISLVLIAIIYSCKKKETKDKDTFRSINYVPHMTILPDTVNTGKIFYLKASVDRENGCQIFDSVEVIQNEKTIQLYFVKKEYNSDDFDCSQDRLYDRRAVQFQLREPGTYEFQFMDGSGNVGKSRTVQVLGQINRKSYQWKFEFEDGALQEPVPENIWLHVAARELSFDDINRDSANHFKKIQMPSDNNISIRLTNQNTDSLIYNTDSLVYSFVTRNQTSFVQWTPLLTRITIFKGVDEHIEKDRLPF